MNSSTLVQKLWNYCTFLGDGEGPRGLVLQADNGSPMKDATRLATLQRHGVGRSFGHPAVCNDNPYSEAPFKTCEYHPAFPGRSSAGSAGMGFSVIIGFSYQTDENTVAQRTNPKKPDKVNRPLTAQNRKSHTTLTLMSCSRVARPRAASRNWL
jgi:transposase InsO family protein